tara:strand:- start:316 stop:513 length:198 start_codon:yes stop_codon:yes gene_type:complete
MKKIIEKNLAELIVTTVFIICFSSCGSTKQIQEKPMKECCKKTAQAVYEYEEWVVNDCENCDEVD